MNPTPLQTSRPRLLRAAAIAASLAALSLASTASASVIIVDDFSTDTRSANYNTSSGRNGFNYSAANERVAPTTGGQISALTHKTSIGSFESLETFSISIDFLTSSLTTKANANAAGVGFATTNTGAIQSTTYAGFEMVARTLNDAAQPATWTVLRFRIGGDAPGEVVSAGFNLAASSWHTLTFNVTELAANSFSISAEIRLRSDNSLVGSLAPTTVSATLASDAALYAGFGGLFNGSPADRGATAFDNFTVSTIPEPSSFAMILGVLALSAVGSRRRRR